MRNPLWPVALTILAAAGGCSSSIEEVPTETSTVAASAASSTNPAQEAPVASQVALRAVDREGYDQAIAELEGHVVLVDFWATWCGECVQQLPHTLELAQSLKDQGLRVVTVSLDDPDAAEQVEQFLVAQKADVATNLLGPHGASSESMEAFEIGGGIPHYKLYDRQGNLHQTFDSDPNAEKPFTPEEIEATVKKLLEE